MNTQLERGVGNDWRIYAFLAICVGVLLAIFMPMIRAARDSAREVQSANNLRQLGLALDNYSSTYKRLPIGADVDGEIGKHGWFTRCMPYIEANPLYNQLSFKVHWEHPIHRQVFYYNYGGSLSPNADSNHSSEGYGLLHYRGNPNIFRINRSVAFAELTAGTSNTWLIGEVDGNFKPWGYPFNWQPLTLPINTGKGSFGGSRGGVQLVMADGALRFISDSIDVETLKSLAEAPPIASPEETQTPSRLFEAAKPSRFTYKYVEVAGYEDRKGGAGRTIRFDNGVAFMADLHEAAGKGLTSIAQEYPKIKALIGVPLHEGTIDLILSFPRLETLSVYEIKLGGKDLERLKALSNLKELVTTDPTVDLEQLKKILTNCDVSRVGW